jgi:hypothetical protein
MGADVAREMRLWELLRLRSLLHVVVARVGAQHQMHRDPSEKEWDTGHKFGTDWFHHNRRVLQGTIEHEHELHDTIIMISENACQLDQKRSKKIETSDSLP